MSKRPPLIGLMLGDAAGIGPEITVKALASGALEGVARPVLFGDRRVLELGIREAGVDIRYKTHASLAGAECETGVPLVDLNNADPGVVAKGRASAAAGRACIQTLQIVIDHALAGELDAICFAPLNKAALHLGGSPFNDGAGLIASMTGFEGDFGEMNVIPQFSTFRVTSHVSLREALDLITPERIAKVVRLADRTLAGMGKARPRLGVAALNPHGGDEGLFGDEEIRIIAPAVRRLQAEGLRVTGPIPADTIFLRARDGEFDAVVMMYHDQGQIATKLLGFDKGVTVQAGQPLVITTPAHGTAFDIAGQGQADAQSMEYALRLAARLAAERSGQVAARA
ncbi:MAG: 4-hydroxythreonine-4-phosphate dehydrogenase [Chloroflexi bacterium]|nr:4-hydroxythreonine-4-phosphate dehydrogenase PdxA [Chloroflexota bacterium]MDE2701628.1 4-hydroxythreonine-4-phosphate dehydrogenase PdxA [Chloroflexota bacterium]MDE2936928.1 4-hydroxythreonine-4-phosphate dehydrogenase PdxA [Chloroflexota bacterium]MXX66615.1 4-hydroxythreonine-4-phosphate dehydrogenase [Chloroflexota bacterium]MXY00951.1 4-hydroxythreonine-4-phosphate dehydrogenase [Chloroflexota bacterium]